MLVLCYHAEMVLGSLEFLMCSDLPLRENVNELEFNSIGSLQFVIGADCNIRRVELFQATALYDSQSLPDSTR